MHLMVYFNNFFEKTSIKNLQIVKDDSVYLKKAAIIIMSYGWTSPFSMSTVNFAFIKDEREPS